MCIRDSKLTVLQPYLAALLDFERPRGMFGVAEVPHGEQASVYERLLDGNMAQPPAIEGPQPELAFCLQDDEGLEAVAPAAPNTPKEQSEGSGSGIETLLDIFSAEEAARAMCGWAPVAHPNSSGCPVLLLSDCLARPPTS
eukprot:569525-Alexandrium_andersonii.AAC.1